MDQQSVLSVRCAMLLACLAMWPGQARAGGFWRSLKNWVDSADIKGCDTTFLHLPKEGFIGYGNIYLTGTDAFLSHELDQMQPETIKASGLLRARASIMLTAGISYRGWGLSYSKDLSRHDDSEWSFCSYGQGYGLELRLHRAHTLHGAIDIEGTDVLGPELAIAKGDLRQRTVLGNFIYVFARKRFSLPAAMSHTIIQKRSSGSWLALANYRHSSLAIANERMSFLIGEGLLNDDITGDVRFRKLSQSQLSLGGGYAYNHILRGGRLLLHLSAIPMVSVWHRNRGYYEVRIWDGQQHLIGDQRYTASFGQKLTFNGTLHGSLVYNFRRYVTGVMAMANIDSFPEEDDFSLYTFDWSTRFFFGVRF